MKKSILSIVLFSILALVSCKKDNGGGGNSFFAKINGETFEVDGFYAYAADFDDHFNIYGVKDEGQGETIYVAVPTGTAKGTYAFDADNFYAYYTDPDGGAFSTVWGGGSGSVTISEIDADHVEGTFQFNAFDAATEAVEKAVTEGKFNVEFR